MGYRLFRMRVAGKLSYLYLIAGCITLAALSYMASGCPGVPEKSPADSGAVRGTLYIT